MLLRIERDDVVTHALGVERKHAAELAAADHADGLNVRSAHSGVLAAAASCIFATYFASRRPTASSPSATIRAAKSAALTAPPMAIVATGTPGGICAIESSESMPCSAFDCTGTPITGSSVLAAVMPGKCAAPPAAAMIARMPRFAADSAYANISSGMRCAETTRISHGIPSSCNVARAGSMVSQSERLPITMPTFGDALRLAIAWRLRGPSEVVMPRSGEERRMPRFLLGINYWPRRSAMYAWERFDLG